ncbi:MAG: sigma-70 family RNA polymerase sigma factor [Saprospiraceae bacterium]|nr:sigma-70 family RNA polymerase sigma factor [Saprospiraceae bacterium]
MLVRKYKQRIYWLVRRNVHQHEDADDLVQDIFIKIYQNLSRFKQQSGLFTWIYRIAVNECLSHLRKKKNGMVWDDPEKSAASLSADTWFEGDKMQAYLHSAIQTLPDKQKLVFQMRYFEEMPYQQMSSILETSEGALKASYHHACKKIEEIIQQYEG